MTTVTLLRSSANNLLHQSMCCAATSVPSEPVLSPAEGANHPPVLIETTPQGFVSDSIKQNHETHEEKKKLRPGTINRRTRKSRVDQILASHNTLIESPGYAPLITDSRRLR